MTKKQSTTTQSKYSLSQRFWQVTIAISISLLIYFVIAKFYYAYFAEKQQHINFYLKTEIEKVDLKIKEIKDLSQFRREYLELMHMQSEFRRIGERNKQYLSEMFNALPFEWSIKQMDISRNQTQLIFEVLNNSNVESSINRLNRQLNQYQITKTSEQVKTGKNYKEIELEVKKLNKSQVNQ